MDNYCAHDDVSQAGEEIPEISAEVQKGVKEIVRNSKENKEKTKEIISTLIEEQIEVKQKVEDLYQGQKDLMRSYTQNINSKLNGINQFMKDMQEQVETLKMRSNVDNQSPIEYKDLAVEEIDSTEDNKFDQEEKSQMSKVTDKIFQGSFGPQGNMGSFRLELTNQAQSAVEAVETGQNMLSGLLSPQKTKDKANDENVANEQSHQFKNIKDKLFAVTKTLKIETEDKQVKDPEEVLESNGEEPMQSKKDLPIKDPTPTKEPEQALESPAASEEAEENEESVVDGEAAAIEELVDAGQVVADKESVTNVQSALVDEPAADLNSPAESEEEADDDEEPKNPQKKKQQAHVAPTAADIMHEMPVQQIGQDELTNANVEMDQILTLPFNPEEDNTIHQSPAFLQEDNYNSVTTMNEDFDLGVKEEKQIKVSDMLSLNKQESFDPSGDDEGQVENDLVKELEKSKDKDPEDADE